MCSGPVNLEIGHRVINLGLLTCIYQNHAFFQVQMAGQSQTALLRWERMSFTTKEGGLPFTSVLLSSFPSSLLSPFKDLFFLIFLFILREFHILNFDHIHHSPIPSQSNSLIPYPPKFSSSHEVLLVFSIYPWFCGHCLSYIFIAVLRQHD